MRCHFPLSCHALSALVLLASALGGGAAHAQAAFASGGSPPAQAHIAATAQAQVEVTFTGVDRYIDAGDGARDTQTNLDVLKSCLQRLGKRTLLPGQRLQIEIVQVDLAGRLVPALRFAQQVRVLNGGADWPRIDLRWVLTQPDGSTQRGEDSLADMTYQLSPLPGNGGEPLRYEQRMLARWFHSRFDAAAAKG
jgi:hypothetical protein